MLQFEYGKQRNIKYQISNNLGQVVKDILGLEIDPQIVVSSELSKGDFSSNIAMVVFGQIKNKKSNLKSPVELAEKIVEHLKLDIGNLEFLDCIEVKAPGFINFFLSQEVISREIDRVIKSSKKIDLTTESSNDSNSSLILEFGDPNPFKEPHIGHLRNFVIGEALARLNEENGIKMIRANYQGDVGLHVAKAIWGIIKLGFDTVDKITPQDLGKSYAYGATEFESNEKTREEIIEINKKSILRIQRS